MTDRAGTPEHRQSTIRDLLAARGRVDVAEVADRLGVAQETVRRDLRVLESAGVLRRVHGGAVAVEAETRVPMPVLATPSRDDAALAERLWAELPRTGTLLIGSGATAVALTAAISAAPPASAGLTVVTNSLDAAVHLAKISTLSVYNVGGTVAPATRAQEGDWALEELGRLRVDTAVLSPAGVALGHGLSESTPAAAAVAQAAIQCATQRIVACSGAVLGRTAFVKYAELSEADRILVAGHADPATVQQFHQSGIDPEIISAVPEAVTAPATGQHVRTA